MRSLLGVILAEYPRAQIAMTILVILMIILVGIGVSLLGEDGKPRRIGIVIIVVAIYGGHWIGRALGF